MAKHALSGCDTVYATYVIGKAMAVKAAGKYTFTRTGHLDSSIDDIMAESTSFVAPCYGSDSVQSLVDCRRNPYHVLYLKELKLPQTKSLIKSSVAVFQPILVKEESAHASTVKCSVQCFVVVVIVLIAIILSRKINSLIVIARMMKMKMTKIWFKSI